MVESEPNAQDALISWEGAASADALIGLPAVIFLDVDGVLHPIDAGDEVSDAEHLDRVLTRWNLLEEVLSSCPAVAVVLSSTWRHGFVVHHARGGMRVCAAAGSKRQLLCGRLQQVLQDRLVSKTPQHAEADRAAEIMAWVNRFKPKAWVAADDEPANLAGLPEVHTVLTDSDSALTSADAAMLLGKLRAQEVSADDGSALAAAACTRLLTPATAPERAWRILYRPGVGRCLVSSRNLVAGEVVFSEMPLIVALVAESEGTRLMRCELVAVATQLLLEPTDSPAYLLQEADVSSSDGGGMRSWTRDVLRALESRPTMRRDDGSEVQLSEEALGWALSVASVNVHGRASPLRGVLGLLASMMEHHCQPSAYVEIASPAEGSVVSLRTKRAIQAGESLSITYVAEDAPGDERRRMLRLCHGFVCTCARCAAELAGEQGASDWRHEWENRIWRSDVDPYSGESVCM